MNKLFVHNPIFRLLSPVFSGVIAYFLILLINNNLIQLQEEFLSQELYVCIVLSFCIHEFSRGLLWGFTKLPFRLSTLVMLIFQVICAVLLSGVIISILIISYYLYAAGYAPLTEELLLFSCIYCTIPVAYILLAISHQYLYKINTQKLENELLIKENIEADFKQFKRDINPSLLFESFEVLLVLIKEDKELVDDFIDQLATIYRYILASRKDQLISVKKELEIVHQLLTIYNHLPYRKIKITSATLSEFLIVPGALLHLIEKIIRTSIVSTKVNLDIVLEENGSFLHMHYAKEDKITNAFGVQSIEEVRRVYSIYSAVPIQILEEGCQRTICIPTLTIKE